jgi:hypothetical protein
MIAAPGRPRPGAAFRSKQRSCVDARLVARDGVERLLPPELSRYFDAKHVIVGTFRA